MDTFQRLRLSPLRWGIRGTDLIKYARDFWNTYSKDGDAYKLVHSVHEELVRRCGEDGLNAKAIELFVRLARGRGQKTYIDMVEVKQSKGTTGGLYPWLKEWGADVLERQAVPKAYRIKDEFYDAMLSLFPSDANGVTTQGIMRLKGLGKRFWAGIDAQDYVNRERAAWAG
jgi:hypothetical protein